jgi:hypothetical protein
MRQDAEKATLVMVASLLAFIKRKGNRPCPGLRSTNEYRGWASLRSYTYLVKPRQSAAVARLVDDIQLSLGLE